MMVLRALQIETESKKTTATTIDQGDHNDHADRRDERDQGDHDDQHEMNYESNDDVINSSRHRTGQANGQARE
jgi:hypothetical protein